MHRIAFISPRRGVGRTTLTANLAAAMLLAGGGGRQGVLALDLDPGNNLRRHHAQPALADRGWLAASLAGDPWGTAGYRSPAGVDGLAFGEHDVENRARFESSLRGLPLWLDEQLGQLPQGLILMDTPPGPGPYLIQALNAATLVIAVIGCETRHLGDLDRVEEYLRHYRLAGQPSPQLHFVLNRTQWNTADTRNVIRSIRQRLGSGQLLWQIHADPKIPEALTHGHPVVTHSPTAPSARDISAMAAWIRTML